MNRRAWIGWSIAGVITVALTALLVCPAGIFAAQLEKLTRGRLTLGDVQGTLWHGSGFVGGAGSAADALVPILPGRFEWRLSPLLLLGKVDVSITNPLALTAPIRLQGDWQEVEVSPAKLLLPAERLAGLGAPLNTIRPSGRMELGWSRLQIVRKQNAADLRGTFRLDVNQVGSAMLPGAPLGSYRVDVDWHGQQGKLTLATVKGPLLLEGAGEVAGGHFQFGGKAQAARGEEERLANLLNIMGQRRQEGNKTIIALEYRQ